jgi:hypothetical protein
MSTKATALPRVAQSAKNVVSSLDDVSASSNVRNPFSGNADFTPSTADVDNAASANEDDLVIVKTESCNDQCGYSLTPRMTTIGQFVKVERPQFDIQPIESGFTSVVQTTSATGENMVYLDYAEGYPGEFCSLENVHEENVSNVQVSVEFFNEIVLSEDAKNIFGIDYLEDSLDGFVGRDNSSKKAVEPIFRAAPRIWNVSNDDGLNENRGDSESGVLTEVMDNLEVDSRIGIGSGVDGMSVDGRIRALEQKVRELEHALEEEKLNGKHLVARRNSLVSLTSQLKADLSAEMALTASLRQRLMNQTVAEMLDNQLPIDPYVPRPYQVPTTLFGELVPSLASFDDFHLSLNKPNVSNMNDIKPGDSDVSKHSCFDAPASVQPAVFGGPPISVGLLSTSIEKPTSVGPPISVEQPTSVEELTSVDFVIKRTESWALDAVDHDTTCDVTVLETGGTKSKTIVDKLKGIPLLLKHLKGGVNWLISDEEDQLEDTMEAVRLNVVSCQSQNIQCAQFPIHLSPPEAAMTSHLGGGDSCPICAEAFAAKMTKSEISAHVDSHRGTYCPLCFSLVKGHEEVKMKTILDGPNLMD